MTIPKREKIDTDVTYNEKLLIYIEELSGTHSTAIAKLAEDHGAELQAKDAEMEKLKAELDAEIEKLKAELAGKDEAMAAEIKALKAAPAVKIVDGAFEFEGQNWVFKNGRINTRIPSHLGPFTVKVDDKDVTYAPKTDIPSELALKIPTLMEYLITIEYGGLQIQE